MAETHSAKVGVIGGSGFYELLEHAREVRLDTPFGDPSDSYFLGEIGGVPVAFLPRHGRGHRILPSEVNYRANVWGMKKLGVRYLLSASAVGSLREELEPLHIVVPDQLYDRTKARPSTFFGDGVVVHMGFADPFCRYASQLVAAAGRAAGATVHEGGTYVCIEGPQFSTRAESELHRSWGASLIGMTVMPEAKLAREAEICYALVALPTDYDCWKPHPASLDQAKLIEEILGHVRAATQNALELIRRAIPRIAEVSEKPCACQSALALAIWSDRSRIPPETKERLRPLLAKYVST